MRLPVLLVILYALLIIGLSSIPGKSFPNMKLLTYDKLIHVGEYAIFGALVSRALIIRVTARGRLFLFTLLITGIFAALDESYQILIPGRDDSYGDWAADVGGVLLGSWLYIWWKYTRDQAPAG